MTDLPAQEQELHRLIDAGDINAAAHWYWQTIGNFSKLNPLHENQTGLRLCRALVDVMTSDNIVADARMAIINDLGQFAVALGDAHTAVEAANAACEVGRAAATMSQAMLARHQAEALVLHGNLNAALRAAWNAQRFFLKQLRAHEGLPTHELMSECDAAHAVEIACLLRMEGVAGVTRALERLARWHNQARTLLARVNTSSQIASVGPTRPLDPQSLLNGYPSALIAHLEGRKNEALELALRWGGLECPDSIPAIDRATLKVRTLLALGKNNEAEKLISALSDAGDDAALSARAAVLHGEAKLARRRPGELLGRNDEALTKALTNGLHLEAIDLLLLRARAFRAMHRIREAKETLRAVLDGHQAAPRMLADFPALAGAQTTQTAGYQLASRQAIALLKHLGQRVDAAIVEAAQASPRDEAPAAPRPLRRPHAPAKARGDQKRRQQLHEQAVDVIRQYEKDGAPFVLYFRTFTVHASHGPMEYGARLTENVLADALPPGVNIITIQDHHPRSINYDGADTSFDRVAPALLLDDRHWEDMATRLIANADLIVSESLMLSPGVKLELERIYALSRWDRTVLLLPPPRSGLGLIDNDPIIQMFVRCVWANELHTGAINEHLVMKDLLQRIGTIGALPVGERRKLRDPIARTKAFPIDMRLLAKQMAMRAALRSQFVDDDASGDLRWEVFWYLFRAASILGWLYANGKADHSDEANLADHMRAMSELMLHARQENGRLLFDGDLQFAEDSAETAYALLARANIPELVEIGARQLEQVRKVRAAVAAQPERFALQPRFGPFITRRAAVN